MLDKYLKSRKGRALALNEIKQVGRIADALAFTIGQMAEIDHAYAAAFPDSGKAKSAPRAKRRDKA